MAHAGAIFIAVCMGLIAASIAATLYLAFGMSGPAATLIGVAALTGLAVVNVISTRQRGERNARDQIAALSGGTADLARQVGELGRRLAQMENKLEASLGRPKDAADPLAAELNELGSLLGQLAESVAAHDAMLADGLAAAQAPATFARSEDEATASAPFAGSDAVSSEAAPVVAFPPAGSPVFAIPQQDAGPIPAPAAAEAGSLLTFGRPDLGGPDRAGERVASGRFKGMSPESIAALVRGAVEANRIDLYLQPIVTLPQRKVRYYEALSRLRTETGEIVQAADFMPYVEAAGLAPRIDNLLLFRCVQVLRRLLLKNREVGLFCNLSGPTLTDGSVFPQLLEFMEANRALAPAMIFEFPQEAVRAMGPIENEALASLARLGFRFSLDNVGDLRLEPRDLAERGFRFVKVPAAQLLNRTPAPADIHPADLAGLLSRFGIDLVAERIESEGTVVDLLDHDTRFGQGYLFSPPRPVRPEALQGAQERADLAGRDAGSAVSAAQGFGAAPGKATEAGQRSGLAQLARTAVDRR